MQSKDLYTQTNNGLTLISSHKGTNQLIAIVLIAMFVSAIFISFFLVVKNETLAYLILPVLLLAGAVIGSKCTYVRCSTINIVTKKIKVKEKFMYRWKKMEFKITDTFIHAKYYPETGGGNESTVTPECWVVQLSIKINDKIIIGKQYYTENETKDAMIQLVKKLYPSLELLTYDEIFEKCDEEIIQIKFKPSKV